jgi:hypothetical protein
MNEPRQVPIGVFSRSPSRSDFTHPGAREAVPETELSGIGTHTGTHHRYALAGAYQPRVRAMVRAFGSQCLREPAG